MPTDDQRARSGTPGDEGQMQQLLAATTWLAERLVSATEDSLPVIARPPWGPDAGASVGNYRHWIKFEEPVVSPPARAELPTGGPLISIVMPVYRPQIWFFRRCVQSVLDQHYRNWQLCMCDDGSDDSELATVMTEFSADPRIDIALNRHNQGISGATNDALALARGEIVVLLDHDDLLHRDALAEVSVAFEDPETDVVYSDDDKVDDDDQRFGPQFKPDWSPDLLYTYMYFGHLVAIRTELVHAVGGFRTAFDGSQDWDLVLRTTERARKVTHIPRVLYHWRSHALSAAGSVSAKPWAHDASRRVVTDAMVRRNIDGRLDDGPSPGIYHLRRKVITRPTISIVMPFRDEATMTANCLSSLVRHPGYDNFEIILVDNNSTDAETKVFKERIAGQAGIRLLEFPGPFNWSAINNAAAQLSDAELLLFMNNDVEATTPGWLAALVEHIERPEVGAVGARLLYPGGQVQHAGAVLGLGGLCAHLFQGMPSSWIGYFLWDRIVRPVSVVTAACMLTKRSVFDEVGQFDESLAVALNDVDYCLRLRRAGHEIIYTPHAELVHHESLSRGVTGFGHDTDAFFAKWSLDDIRVDPYYNRNLTCFELDCKLRTERELQRWEEFGRFVTGASATAPRPA